MSWRLRLIRNGPGHTIRRIGRAVTKAAQALTSDLIRSTSEDDEQELEQGETPEHRVSTDDDDNEIRAGRSGDGDRGDESREDRDTSDDEESEDSDTSTVGTSAKIRLRRKHKRRFLRARDDVYAHQYVYRILAESGIYQQPVETSEGECDKSRTTTFPMVGTTLAILRAMRTLDAENRKQLMGRILSSVKSQGRSLSPAVLYR